MRTSSRRRSVRRATVGVAAAALLLAPAAALAQDAAAADTSPKQTDPELGSVSVTDVRVGTHDGFDRVTFEVEGDGLAGWFVEYDDDPRAQGTGFPIEVAGETSLFMRISSVWLPPDAPEGIEQWEGDVPGPAGGVVLEVVDDVIFEGIHTFAIGLDEELPFTVERFEDPQRIVVDIFHDVDDVDDVPVPRDGVEAGFGGTAGADAFPFAALLALVAAGMLLLVGGGVLAHRSRR